MKPIGLYAKLLASRLDFKLSRVQRSKILALPSQPSSADSRPMMEKQRRRFEGRERQLSDENAEMKRQLKELRESAKSANFATAVSTVATESDASSDSVAV